MGVLVAWLRETPLDANELLRLHDPEVKTCDKAAAPLSLMLETIYLGLPNFPCGCT